MLGGRETWVARIQSSQLTGLPWELLLKWEEPLNTAVASRFSTVYRSMRNSG